MPPDTAPPSSRRSELPSLLADGGLVGDSRVIRDLGKRLTKVAASDASVLVTGESGTGKELVSRVIHFRSGRSEGPFVAVNSAALPESLLESQLFGHVKGSFTGATQDAVGLFRQANGGTLFLDEVAELSLELQAKLLRVLQERVIRPIGGVKELPVDVRLVAATNKNLESAVEDGEFREDLLYRINVIDVHVPPLRDRGADAVTLAKHFLGEMALRDGRHLRGFSEEALGAIRRYAFPGNVRELRNFVEHAVALADGPLVEFDDLPIRLQEALGRDWESPSTPGASAPGANGFEPMTLEEVTRRHILGTLAHAKGNRTHAADLLGIDRRTLVRKLKKLERS